MKPSVPTSHNAYRRILEGFFFIALSSSLSAPSAAQNSPPPNASNPSANAAPNSAPSAATSAPGPGAGVAAGAKATPGSPGMQPVNPNDPNVEMPTNVGIFSRLMDPFEYDPNGKRDPFGQPVSEKPLAQGLMHGPLLPLQRFELNQLRLTAILWDVRQPKAMLKDPTGATYIVTPNTKIGPRNGYIAVIREGEIVVVETLEQEGRLISTSQVVKIAK